MKTNKIFKNIILNNLSISFLIALLSCFFIVKYTEYQLLSHIQIESNVFIKEAFDDFLFSNNKGKANDHDGLSNLAEKINKKILIDLDHPRSFVIDDIKVQLEKIDGQNISTYVTKNNHQMSKIKVIRELNSIPREFIFVVIYWYAWKSIIFLFIASLIFMIIFSFIIPRPFSSKEQIEIFIILDNMGIWKLKEVVNFVKNFIVKNENISEYQLRLIQEISRYFSLENLGKLIRDKRLKTFDKMTWIWFQIARKNSPEDWDEAFRIATSPDQVVINHVRGLLKIHGMIIEIDPTPLVYYFWYARKRLANENEGWMLNPEKDRVNEAYQKEIDQIINEINDYGAICIKTSNKKTNNTEIDGGQLANIRNRISKSIKDAIGDEELANCYLFDKRFAKNGRQEVRLHVDPTQIIVEPIATPSPSTAFSLSSSPRLPSPPALQ